MPSFLIRGLARYFAASAMESRTRRQSSFSPSSRPSSNDNKKLSDADLVSWQMHMRWLIPLAQATGYQIVINNPKSHEQIIIDQNTKILPDLTLKWMQKYNKQELLEWMEKEKDRQQQKEEERQKYLDARRIEEARGRARFGNSFTLSEQNAQDKKSKSQKVSKSNYVKPILCLIYVFIIVMIGLWVYNSSLFEVERHDKDWEKYNTIMLEAENSPITEIMTPEGFRFDMNENEFNLLNKRRKMNVLDNLYGCKEYKSLLSSHGHRHINSNFHKGKLCSYEIMIIGRMENESKTELTDNDVKKICNYYKAFLGKNYTLIKLPDFLYSRGGDKTFVFRKENMVIRLDYINDAISNYIAISCENRPISAPIEREKRDKLMEEERKKMRPRSESQYPYSRF